MRKSHYTLIGATVSPFDQSKKDGKTNNFRSDTLRNIVRFDITPQFEKLENSDAKPFLITNKIDKSKSRLTVNKPIWYNDTKFKAGVNLLEFESPSNIISGKVTMMPCVDIGSLTPLIGRTITFERAFKFPPDTYTFTFHWETFHGETFVSIVQVPIDIKKSLSQ